MKTVGLMMTAGLLYASPVQAQNGAPYTILGQGTKTCGRWTADNKEASFGKNSNRAWVLGFLTAYNLISGRKGNNVTASVDADGMMAWVDNYCAANPLESVSAASIALLTELTKKDP
jgi:hypothetical protein